MGAASPSANSYIAVATQTIRLPPPITVNLYPIGFYQYGQDFLEATKTRRRARPNSTVPHFLCCQAIEHGLKAFLSWKGYAISDLRSKKYGHDLTKLLGEAKGKSLDDFVTLTANEQKTIAAATAFYDSALLGTTGKRKVSKRLQYFDPFTSVQGHPGLPDLRTLKRIARRLVQNKALEDEYIVDA